MLQGAPANKLPSLNQIFQHLELRSSSFALTLEQRKIIEKLKISYYATIGKAMADDLKQTSTPPQVKRSPSEYDRQTSLRDFTSPSSLFATEGDQHASTYNDMLSSLSLPDLESIMTEATMSDQDRRDKEQELYRLILRLFKLSDDKGGRTDAASFIQEYSTQLETIKGSVNCGTLFLTLLLTKFDPIEHVNLISARTEVIKSLSTSWNGMNVAEYKSKATNIINDWYNMSRRSGYFNSSYSTSLPLSEITDIIAATFGRPVNARPVHPIWSQFAYSYTHTARRGRFQGYSDEAILEHLWEEARKTQMGLREQEVPHVITTLAQGKTTGVNHSATTFAGSAAGNEITRADSCFFEPYRRLQEAATSGDVPSFRGDYDSHSTRIGDLSLDQLTERLTQHVAATVTATVQKELHNQREMIAKKDPATNWRQKQGADMRSKQVHGGDKGKDTAPARSTEKNFDKSKPPCGFCSRSPCEAVRGLAHKHSETECVAKLARDHIRSRWTENAETQDRGAKTFNNGQRQQRGRREDPQGQRANEDNGGHSANLAKGLPSELTKQLEHCDSGGSASENESLFGFEYAGVATEVLSPTDSNGKAVLDSSDGSVSPMPVDSGEFLGSVNISPKFSALSLQQIQEIVHDVESASVETGREYVADLLRARLSDGSDQRIKQLLQMYDLKTLVHTLSGIDVFRAIVTTNEMIPIGDLVQTQDIEAADPDSADHDMLDRIDVVGQLNAVADGELSRDRELLGAEALLQLYDELQPLSVDETKSLQAGDHYDGSLVSAGVSSFSSDLPTVCQIEIVPVNRFMSGFVMTTYLDTIMLDSATEIVTSHRLTTAQFYNLVSEQCGLPPGSFILRHESRVLASRAQIALSSLLHSHSPIVFLEQIQPAGSLDPPDDGSSTRKVGNVSTNTLLRDSAGMPCQPTSLLLATVRSRAEVLGRYVHGVVASDSSTHNRHLLTASQLDIVRTRLGPIYQAAFLNADVLPDDHLPFAVQIRESAVTISRQFLNLSLMDGSLVNFYPDRAIHLPTPNDDLCFWSSLDRLGHPAPALKAKVAHVLQTEPELQITPKHKLYEIIQDDFGVDIRVPDEAQHLIYKLRLYTHNLPRGVILAGEHWPRDSVYLLVAQLVERSILLFSKHDLGNVLCLSALYPNWNSSDTQPPICLYHGAVDDAGTLFFDRWGIVRSATGTLTGTHFDALLPTDDKEIFDTTDMFMLTYPFEVPPCTCAAVAPDGPPAASHSEDISSMVTAPVYFSGHNDLDLGVSSGPSSIASDIPSLHMESDDNDTNAVLTLLYPSLQDVHSQSQVAIGDPAPLSPLCPDGTHRAAQLPQPSQFVQTLNTNLKLFLLDFKDAIHDSEDCINDVLDSFYCLQQEYDRASSKAISTATVYSDAKADWFSRTFQYHRIINLLRSDLESQRAESLAARAELVSVKISQVDHLAQKLQSLTEKHIALQQQYDQSRTEVDELREALRKSQLHHAMCADVLRVSRCNEISLQAQLLNQSTHSPVGPDTTSAHIGRLESQVNSLRRDVDTLLSNSRLSESSRNVSTDSLRGSVSQRQFRPRSSQWSRSNPGPKPQRSVSFNHQRESPPVASRTRSRTTVAPVVNVAAERTFILSSIQSFAAVRLNKFLVLRPVRHDPVLAAHTLATWEELMSQMWHDILHQQRSPKFTLNLLQDRNAALHRNYAVCRAFFQAMFLAKRVSTVRPLNPLATTFAPLQHDLVLPPSTPPPPVLVSTPPVSPVSADPLDFSLSDRLYLAVSPTVTGAFELASKVSSTFGSFFLTPSPVNPSS